MPELCTFRVGDLQLALRTEDVQEVVLERTATSVPLAPAAVAGLINLRGSIVTALNLRHSLGLASECDGPGMGVVLKGEERVCLLVDDIGNVLDTEEEGTRPLENLPAAVRAIARALHKTEHGVLVEVDAARLIGETAS